MSNIEHTIKFGIPKVPFHMIILAPTGAGKTHFIRTASSNRMPSHRMLIDGDRIPQVATLYERLHQQFGKEWWLDPEHKSMKKQGLKEVIPHLDRHFKGDIILTAERGLVGPNAVVVTVLPPADRLIENLRDRARQSVISQPTSLTLVVDAARSLHEYSMRRGIPITDDFEKAVDLLYAGKGRKI